MTTWPRCASARCDAIATHGVDPVLHELVLRHEQQHTETMLQTLLLGRLPGYEHPGAGAAPPAPGGHSGLEFVAVPGGEIELGAPDGRFSYDNERPRHRVRVAPFQIARTPVTNATWLEFAEGGGYERREWWTDEAWAWKQQYDITHPLHWARRPDGAWVEHTMHGPRALDPDRPAAHVSWFEAAAVARAHGARLPTETEWEAAATWDQPTSRPRQPRSAHLRHGARRRVPRERHDVRRARHARQRLGVDVERVRRLPRLSRPPLPRVLRGLLPHRPPRPARWLVGDAGTRRDADLPQLGPATAPPDLQRRAARRSNEEQT